MTKGSVVLNPRKLGPMGFVREIAAAERIHTAVLGHHVPHLHMWLVPRYPGTPADLRGMGVLRWPDAPKQGAAEIAAPCEEIRRGCSR